MAASNSGAAKKPAVKKKATSKKKVTAKKKTAVKKAAPAKKKAAARKKTAPAKKSSTRKQAAGKAGPVKGSAAGYGRDAWDKKPASTNKPAEQPLMKTLRAEHRHIATVMQLFSEQMQSIESGDSVDPHVVFEVMEYMATWPDKYHHPREDLIYCRVAELDAKAADDVDSLQRDHDRTAERGQQLLRDIELWREDELDAAVIVKRGREYITHMYEHMNIEEKVVFPHIETVLTLEDWRELAEDDELRAVSAPVFGPRVQREFRNMTRRLRRGVRRTVERGAVVEWIGIEALMESLEVLSMAYESARSTAGEHWQMVVDDSREMFRESPVTAPVRCSLNNMKLGYRLLEDFMEISREVFDDLEKVNDERRERVSLFDS